MKKVKMLLLLVALVLGAKGRAQEDSLQAIFLSPSLCSKNESYQKQQHLNFLHSISYLFIIQLLFIRFSHLFIFRLFRFRHACRLQFLDTFHCISR